MATATLTARPRSDFGKNAMRRLRKQGFVPAVIYGHGDKPQALLVSAHDLERLLSSIVAGSTILDVQVEGEGAQQALIREVQYHPGKPQILHLDLFHVHAGEKLHLELPIRIHGSPVGVRDNGGVMQQVLHTLSIECLPRHIPEAFDLHVDDLDVGQAVHVSDVSLPNVKVLNDPDLVICTVTPPTVAALPEGPETERSQAGDVEPELVRDRRADAKDVDSDHGSSPPSR